MIEGIISTNLANARYKLSLKLSGKVFVFTPNLNTKTDWANLYSNSFIFFTSGLDYINKTLKNFEKLDCKIIIDSLSELMSIEQADSKRGQYELGKLLSTLKSFSKEVYFVLERRNFEGREYVAWKKALATIIDNWEEVK